MLTTNDRSRGLVNGSRGTVEVINPSARCILVRLTDGGAVTLDEAWLANGHLAHGYAVTVHKAQGLTVDTTLIYGLGPLTREHAYVAVSRGRKANHIYIADDSEFTPDCGPVADHDERALTAELLARMSTSHRHRLATSYLPSTEPSRDIGNDNVLRRLLHDNGGYDRAQARGL
jgi:hypothetical protein